MRDDKILKLFDEFSKNDYKDISNLHYYLLQLCLLEQLVFVDLVLSYLLYSYNYLKIKFNSNDALQEIKLLSKNLFLFIDNNNLFFTNIYNDIYAIIIDKKQFKTQFTSIFKNPMFDALIYLNAIIRGLYFIDDSLEIDIDSLKNNALHRSIISNNILNYSKVFTYFHLEVFVNFKNNCFKLLILLHKYIKIIKIVTSIKDVNKNNSNIKDDDDYKINNQNNNKTKDKNNKLNNKKDVKYKTEIYIKFNIDKNIKYINKLMLIYCLKPYILLNNSFIGCSHLNIYSTIKKSKHQFNKNKIDITSLKTLTNIPVQIDFTYWHIISKKIEIKILEKYTNINTDGTITYLSEQIQQILYKEYKIFKNLKIIINDIEYKDLKILEKKLEQLKQDTINNKYIILVENQIEILKKIILKYKQQILLLSNNIKDIQKDMQQLFYILIIEQSKNITYPVYTSFYFDFRGRIYPNSFLSFMYLKIIRSFFVFKKIDLNLQEIQNSNYFKNIIKQDINFNNYLFKFEQTDLNKYFLSILFLELGKLTKKFYINCGATLQNFVDEGIKMYYQIEYNNIKIDDLGYVYKIKQCIVNFEKNNLWEDITIIRDSTASSFQHWGRVLQVNEKYLNTLNFINHIWFDTYTKILELFLKIYPKYNNMLELTNIINRKYLKKIIMTVNYNAGRLKCLEEFIEELKLDKLFNEQHMDIYKQFIFDLYIYLNIELFKEFYKNDKVEFLDKFSEKLELDDAVINLMYNFSKEHKEVIKIKNIRWIFTNIQLTIQSCLFKTKIALNANIIQALDAELVRFLLRYCDIWTVHDGFAINLFQIHKLYQYTCEFFSKKLNTNCDNIFILI